MVRTRMARVTQAVAWEVEVFEKAAALASAQNLSFQEFARRALAEKVEREEAGDARHNTPAL